MSHLGGVEPSKNSKWRPGRGAATSLSLAPLGLEERDRYTTVYSARFGPDPAERDGGGEL